MITQTQVQALPHGFVVRHPSMDDVEAVAELLQAFELDLHGQAETTLDDLRVEWQTPDFNLATDMWIVLSPEGKVVGEAEVDHQQHARLYSRVIVHPNYRE